MFDLFCPAFSISKFKVINFVDMSSALPVSFELSHKGGTLRYWNPQKMAKSLTKIDVLLQKSQLIKNRGKVCLTIENFLEWLDSHEDSTFQTGLVEIGEGIQIINRFSVQLHIPKRHKMKLKFQL